MAKQHMDESRGMIKEVSEIIRQMEIHSLGLIERSSDGGKQTFRHQYPRKVALWICFARCRLVHRGTTR